MGKDIKAIKDFLFMYRNKMKDIKSLEDKLYLIKCRIENIGSIDYTKEKTSTYKYNAMCFLIDKKANLENQISEAYKDSLSTKQEIMEVIEQVDDPLLCRILERFFIDLMSMNDISKEIDRTERHVYRLYKKAIESVPGESILKMSVKCQ